MPYAIRGMRRLLYCVVLLVLLSPVLGDQFIFDDTLYQAREIQLSTQISGSLDWSGSASQVRAELFYYPKPFSGQQIIEQSASPPAAAGDDSLLFTFSNPSSSPVTFTHQSILLSEYQRPRITSQVDFPFSSIPSSYDEYLQSEQIIRVTDDIRRLAQSIVGDEDDAVRAVFEMGVWVTENIDYDLNSVTADASQDSQWVLDNREGVCDELTSLFIAMVRSQGIPARFVSGVAYTNLEELESPWGPHGWAEVWFPDVGWVPYDVTYGQYGWVDATHVSYLKSTDASSNAASYSLRGRNAQLFPASLSREVELIDRRGGVPLYVTYDVSPALAETGLQGFNRIDVTLSNDMPFYVSTKLFIGRTDGLSSDDYGKPVLLGPREERTVSWLVEIDDSLQQGFRYTFPIVIYTNDNQQWRSEFSAVSGGVVASSEELMLADEPTSLSQDPLVCQAPRSASINEEFVIRCESNNSQICIEDTCGDGTLVYEASFSSPGVYNLVASSQSQRQVVTVSVRDSPSFLLSAQAPSVLSFSDQAVINVTLQKTSVSNPQDVTVKLSHDLYSQEWAVGELSGNTTVRLVLEGSQLSAGQNRFVIESGSQSTQVFIDSRPESFANRMVLWRNSLYGVISRMFGLS